MIGKQANFRSALTVVDCLNRMRPDLPQFVVDPSEQDSIHIFHTNTWAGGPRLTSSHWRGDLPSEVVDQAPQSVLDRLTENGWELSSDATKVLMLTHRVLASKRVKDKIRRPVFFGEYAQPDLQYEVDTWHPEWWAGLEIETGHLVVN